MIPHGRSGEGRHLRSPANRPLRRRSGVRDCREIPYDFRFGLCVMMTDQGRGIDPAPVVEASDT
jgi:hypothetical protein